MWWKVALQVAVQLGLDKWAKRKAADLIAKVKEKAEAKIGHLEEVQKMIEVKALAAMPPSGATAVFRAKDGSDYVVRVERKV